MIFEWSPDDPAALRLVATSVALRLVVGGAGKSQGRGPPWALPLGLLDEMMEAASRA